MKKPILLLCILVLAVACKDPVIDAKIPEISNPVSDSLTKKLDSIYLQSPIVGFSVAIVNLNGVIYNKGFGYADSKGQKYTATTIQNIGSISKTFIGMSLLKAQELGVLRLDDPVNNHLPFKVVNTKYPEIPITLRQLATHTSSILDSDYYGLSYVLIDSTVAPNEKNIEYFNPANTKISMEEYLEKVLSENGIWNKGESFADSEPGRKYVYTNLGATLAALAIQNATELSFADFSRKYILEPLEMSGSGWSNAEINIKNRSSAFINKDTLVAPYELITYPDGGLITSTENLSRFLIELMKGMSGSGSILSADSYNELFTKQLIQSQLPENHKEGNTGIFIDYGKRGIGHSGGDPGILTFMFFNPETKIGKILFMNTDYEENRSALQNFIQVWRTLEAFEDKL